MYFVKYSPLDLHSQLYVLQGAFEVKSHKSLQMLLDCLQLDPSTFVRVQVSFSIQLYCYNNCSVYFWEVQSGTIAQRICLYNLQWQRDMILMSVLSTIEGGACTVH